ncbi:MAG: pilus assembly protein TadG-related protein [Porphyrobacter sp.]|nr:pilus assembly protein TadG-related protein [Porphyrobacter sp.]
MMYDQKLTRPTFLRKLGHGFLRLKQDTSAATAALFAILLPILIGFGALAIDVGVWSMKSRQAQGAADQAAYSAAVASSAGTNAIIEGRAIAASMGFKDGVGGVTVSVDNPPTSGAFSGVTTYWQVTIRQPQYLGLAALFTAGAPAVVARAVAGSGRGNACVIGLNTTGSAVTFINNTSFYQAECGLYSNSNIDLRNGVTVSSGLYAGDSIILGNTTQITGSMATDQPLFIDPYLGTSGVTPTTMPCIRSAITNGGTYLPGRYCAGLNLKDNAKNTVVNLQPGVYYFQKEFKVGNGFTFRGTDVTIILDFPNTPGAPGQVDFQIGQYNVFDITAPTSGPFSGIALLNTTSVNGSLYKFGINNTVSIQGALYFPNSTLDMNNNLDANRCTQMVALNVELSNNATTKADCPGSGIKGVGGGKIVLVE